MSERRELALQVIDEVEKAVVGLSLIHISEPTRDSTSSRMPSSA